MGRFQRSTSSPTRSRAFSQSRACLQTAAQALSLWHFSPLAEVVTAPGVGQDELVGGSRAGGWTILSRLLIHTTSSVDVLPHVVILTTHAVTLGASSTMVHARRKLCVSIIRTIVEGRRTGPPRRLHACSLPDVPASMTETGTRNKQGSRLSNEPNVHTYTHYI